MGSTRQKTQTTTTRDSTQTTPSRRKVLLAGIGVVTLGAAAVVGYRTLMPTLAAASSSATKTAVMYKPLKCGCCDDYADYLEQYGFSIEVHSRRSLSEVRRSAGVPPGFAGCHTLLVDGYTVDGLVPIAILRKLLDDKPNIKGITLPGMPWGAPGMQQRPKARPLVVYAFNDSDANPTIYAQE